MSSATWAATADPTRATGGYTYFNRPGASAASYQRDLRICVNKATAALPADIGGVGLAGAFVASTVQWGRVETDLQNCMTIAGWRVVRLPDAQGAPLYRQPAAEIDRQLAAWVGAENPPGDVVRSYENDIARRGAVLFTITTYLSQATTYSLSWKAFDMSQVKLRQKKNVFRASEEGSKFAARAMTPANMHGPGPDEAMIVFSWSGKSASSYDGMDFRRFGSDSDGYAFDDDGHVDQFVLLGRHPTVTAGDRKVYAMTIPAGKWRLFTRGGLELCLGAPSFAAKAGEVIYLGHFDFSANVIKPDMSVEALKAALPLPADVAANLRPAAWVNGSEWPCHILFAAFAEDFEGFPSVRPPPS